MNRSLLSRVSPVMLIVFTVLLISLVPFLTRWEEFAAAGLFCLILAAAARSGWRFWIRYIKISLPLVILSAFFNWLLFLPGGVSTLWSGHVFKSTDNLEALYRALVIGGRFAIALYFSLLLVQICSHEELVWGLTWFSNRLLRRPVVGKILALALLSVPFFLDYLSRVRRWRDLPKAVAEVFKEAEVISVHPVEIKDKKPGWGLLALGVVLVALAVVVR